MIKSDPFLQENTTSTIIRMSVAFPNTTTVPLLNRVKRTTPNSSGPQHLDVEL